MLAIPSVLGVALIPILPAELMRSLSTLAVTSAIVSLAGNYKCVFVSSR